MMGQPEANMPDYYRVVACGGLFNQHELSANVLIKEAIWRLSAGRFRLILPQTKELRQDERLDLAAHIRNLDLLNVVEADIVLVRFDGLELDSGTVVEFSLAKFLGKPVVILRCDSRRLFMDGLDEPYNLMVKNWPRTIEVHADSLMRYVALLEETRHADEEGGSFTAELRAESKAIHKGIEELASKIIDGLELAQQIGSPYPSEFQEIVYKVIRHMPGSGFDRLVTDEDIGNLVERLRENGSL